MINEHAPQFGIGHLNLVQAGHLIAACLWLRGDLTAKVPEKDTYRFDDPELEAPLRKFAKQYSKQLTNAVTSGTLYAAYISHDLDDQVRPEATYVEALTLAAWLEAREINLGAAFGEYLETEDTIRGEVYQAMRQSRLKWQYMERPQETPEVTILKLENQKLHMELEELRKPALPRGRITEKQRGAYLNIIGALIGLLLGHGPNGTPYSRFQTQQAVIDAIHGNFGDQVGLSQRNLEDKFAEGKRTLQSTNKPR